VKQKSIRLAAILLLAALSLTPVVKADNPEPDCTANPGACGGPPAPLPSPLPWPL